MLPNHKTHITSVMIVTIPRQDLEICLYETSVAAPVFLELNRLFLLCVFVLLKAPERKMSKLLEKS